MCSASSRPILPEPPEELKRLSNGLAERIGAKIKRGGPIPFSDYMEMALYDPHAGYYSAGLQKFGEGGDFVTAPQLGDVFARCLAKQITEIRDAIVDDCADKNGDWEIVEAGAGSGILAAELLKALQDGHAPSRYRILERSAHLRQVQKETLLKAVPQWMDRISWLDAPPESGWQGVFLANEVLDALTVERFCVGATQNNSAAIKRMCVGTGANGFKWHKGTFSEEVADQIQSRLSATGQFPATGYCSEINTRLPAWLMAVTEHLQKGSALFIDYGYTRREYYHPQRSDGTLVCHYRHRAHDDPFKWPGLTDISAFVDFTALAEAADFCGLKVSGYTTQAMFLAACGLQEIISGFQDLPEKEQFLMNAQVRRLTLPVEMGERFQVMALSRDIKIDLRGFSLQDMRHRL